MSVRFFAPAFGVFAVVPAAAAAEPLDAAQIEAVIPGAATSGINAFGNPYTVRFLEDGRIEGVAGSGDEYRDGGTWWLEGDALCRRWEVWLEGRTNCFSVTIEDGTITWLDIADGKTTVESLTPAQ